MGIGDFFKHILAPESESKNDVTALTGDNTIYRQDVLDALHTAFNISLKEETTTESMLCHTFYKVYISEEYYDKISASFHKTAEDAVKVFTRELKSKRTNYPDFVPFAPRWEFHLIPTAPGVIISGLEDSKSCITIVSRLWAKNVSSDDDDADGEREVVTLHDKNSLLKVPKEFNYSQLRHLIAAEKDKAIFRFTLDDDISPVSAAVSASSTSTKQGGVLATIRINGGTFIEGNRTFTSYNMKLPTLRIAGKNGSIANDGVPVLCINSDKILNHHIEIVFDTSAKTFKITTLGDAKLNEFRLSPGVDNWKLLPLQSNISLADFDLTFKASSKA